MSDDPILARQRAAAEQAREVIEEQQAAQKAHDRLVAANNRVEDLGGAFEHELKTDKRYLKCWAKAMAEYKGELAERGWLERLAQPPTGAIDAYDRDAWAKAVEIFLMADAKPARAVAMLAELATAVPGFAMSVAGCLRRGIRRVAEWVEPKQPAIEPAKDEAPAERPTVYYLGDRTYRVGESEPVPVHDNYDCLLRAFIGRSVLDLPALVERSGLDRSRIVGVLGRLKKIHKGLFADAIDCPGVGGKGQGYRATVIDACPDRKN